MNMANRRKKIVVIGGGTGTFTVLSGLKKYPVDLSAVVSMADDGGSTGVLREEFGMLPTGDVRRALVALSSHSSKLLADLFSYRFREGSVNGHSFGNLMLTALERVTGSFEEAIAVASRLLNVQGNVIPVTYSNVRLYAELADGAVIRGETNIDIPKHDGTVSVKRVWLHPKARANPKAIHAIRNADLIIVGPGDLYTSIIPNIVVSGIRNAICQSRAKKGYITNLMTKYGETHGFSGNDFLMELEKYLAPGVFDTILINTTKPSAQILKRYKRERAQWIDYGDITGTVAVRTPLLRGGNLVRHDPAKLAKALMNMV